MVMRKDTQPEPATPGATFPECCRGLSQDQPRLLAHMRFLNLI